MTGMKEQKFDFLLFFKMKFNKYITNQKLTLIYTMVLSILKYNVENYFIEAKFSTRLGRE